MGSSSLRQDIENLRERRPVEARRHSNDLATLCDHFDGGAADDPNGVSPFDQVTATSS